MTQGNEIGGGPPLLEEDFAALLKEYQVGLKGDYYKTMAKHISRIGGSSVYEDPAKLAETLTEFSQHIDPVKRKLVLSRWFSEKNIPVPEKLLRETGMSRVEKEEEEKREKSERQPEKYSVDTETGSIRPALTTEKTAMTWDEAQQLSNNIKKELAEKEKKGGKKVTYVYDTETRLVRMAKEGEVGGTLEQARELKKMAEEGKGKEVGEAEAADRDKKKSKYSVDEATGVIKVATTSENALTWDEAEKLSNNIKKELTEKEKKGGEKVTYVYDSVDRAVRMAKEGEVGGTLEQAKELKKMAEEGKGEEVESPFIQNEEGNWMINPKARVTGVELMAFEALKRSQDRGEPLDPIEALGQAAERMKVFQEALGGGGRMPDWMTDPVRFIETVERISGGGKVDEGLKAELTEMKRTLDDMREDKYRSQIVGQQEQIKILTGKVDELLGQITDLRKPAGGKTEMDILYEIATKGTEVIKTEAAGTRAMIREVVGGVGLPPSKTPEEREKRKDRYRKGLETDRHIETLGRRLFFGETPEGEH